jgi:hypothetical protein
MTREVALMGTEGTTDIATTGPIMPAGYDPESPDANAEAYATAMLAEAKSLYDSAERFAVLIATIKNHKLYQQLGYDHWQDFVDREFGVSRSTGNRWVSHGEAILALQEGDEGPENTNGQVSASRDAGHSGLGVPERPTGPRISQRAATRRHVTLDQPPTTIDPSPEPLHEAPGEDDEPLPRPEGPPAPSPRNQPIGFPVTGDYRVPTGRPEGRPIKVDGVVDRARAGREGLNRLMAALHGALNTTTEAEMAAAATRTERIQIAKLGAAFTVEDRKALRPEGVVLPADCDHPANRIIGNQCGKCGATKKGAKR